MLFYSLLAMLLTVASADEAPRITHVGMVASHIIGITFETGRVEHGSQIPYQSQDGDEVENHNHHRWVKRDGKYIGSLAGHDGDILYTLDRLTGEKLDTAWADRPESYQITSADDLAAWSRKTGFRWTKDPWRPVGWGALSTPDGISLVRAHAITGDEKYLRAVVLACQPGAGANPANICYTTGLGHRSPQNPLHLDSRVTNQPPPPGLTVFGPVDTQKNKDYWLHKSLNSVSYPPVQEWPTMEAYWDVFWYPSMCEFTVQQPMAENAYVWGYLAARK